jgi:hypothetical protein
MLKHYDVGFTGIGNWLDLSMVLAIAVARWILVKRRERYYIATLDQGNKNNPI